METLDFTEFYSLKKKEIIQELPVSLQIPSKTIIFFSSNDEISRSIIDSFDNLSEKFQVIGCSFQIINTEKTAYPFTRNYVAEINRIIEYKLPVLKVSDLHFSNWLNDEKPVFKNNLQTFLSTYENSSSEWNSGFYINVNGEYFYSTLGYSHNFSDYITSCLDFVHTQKKGLDSGWSGGYFSPVETPFFEDEPEPIDVDSEVKEKIELIERNLNELKESGDFYLILPLLQKYIDENKIDITSKPDLTLSISKEDFRITIPELNTEVKMNALTKAVYFLFLSVGGEGIHLKNLTPYLYYLHSIYKTVSNRTDLEQITNSVYAFKNQDNNLIYMHLSRIKSAFCELMDDEYAKEFYVVGQKNLKKSISQETCNKSKIKEFYQIWGYPPGEQETWRNDEKKSKQTPRSNIDF